MIRQGRLFHSFLLLFLFLAGCSGLGKDYPERNYYILSVSRDVGDSSPVPEAVLEIRRFQISPGFSGREFVYRKGDLGYVSDFYNQFFRPPVLLITEEVRRWLSESGLFRSVVDPTSTAEPDYVLEGNINELYGDFRMKGAPKAVMGIQFLLIGVQSASPRIAFQNSYRREVAIVSSSPDDLIEGWNDALVQILAAFEGDLRKAGLRVEKGD